MHFRSRHEKTAHAGVDGCKRTPGRAFAYSNDNYACEADDCLRAMQTTSGSQETDTTPFRRLGTRARVPCPQYEPSRTSRRRRTSVCTQELEERSTTRRREISLWIERAREHGDISENADYDAAKNEQGHNEARIRQLEAMLKNAVVHRIARRGRRRRARRARRPALRRRRRPRRRISSARSRNGTRSTTCCRPTRRSARRSSASRPGRS